MYLTIENLLSGNDVAALRKLLESTKFSDGKLTAGEAVRHAKNNLQVTDSNPQLDKFRVMIMNNFSQSEAFKQFALPKRILPPVFNRYDVGMKYGDHVDNAIFGAGNETVRADVSATVFLSEPDTYDGGGLVMNSDKGGKPVKLPAGSAIVYSSATVHKVEPVTRGSRYAAITWIQSLVRDEHRREIISELAELARWSRSVAPGSVEAMRVSKIRMNLMRMWVDL